VVLVFHCYTPAEAVGWHHMDDDLCHFIDTNGFRRSKLIDCTGYFWLAFGVLTKESALIWSNLSLILFVMGVGLVIGFFWSKYVANKTKVVVSVRREGRESSLGRGSRCFGHGDDARDGFVGFCTAKRVTDGLMF
jgi:hypothetical protein